MVHWDQQKVKRLMLMKLMILTAVAAGVIFMNGASDATVADHVALTVRDSARLPMAELSGSATTVAGGKRMFYGVSDASSMLLTTELTAEGEVVPESITTRDFGPALLERFSLCKQESTSHCAKIVKDLTTQWEAIAVDGAGRVFVVQETSSSVVVLSPDLSRVVSVLSFDFFVTKDGYRQRPAKKAASNLAEGIVLLRNGHVLVAKEGFPASLVEFGPAGDAPLGLSSASLLPPGEAFVLPGAADAPSPRLDLAPLMSWTRKGGDAGCDQSEISAEVDGSLYVMSEKCQSIVRYDGLSVIEPYATVRAAWTLPSKVHHPESLVALGAGAFLVGSDNKGKKPNIFRLIER